MKIRLKLASLVLLLFVLTNCIKENECCCSQDYTVLGLKFRYATNKSIHQQTEFPPNAILAVFIFDDKGTFVSQINDSLNQVNDDYTMKLPFKQGSYQFVAWTGYDETCYQLSACIPQQTDIHDFFLSLKREKDNQTINQPSLLYHGIHDIVKIREGKENIVWIDLKQITNHIQVIVHNLNDKRNISSILKTTMGNMTLSCSMPMMKNYLSSHLLKSIKHHIFSHSRFHGNEAG